MLLGSEGILGVITEAWVRVQPRPRPPRRRARCASTRFAGGAEAVRALVQSGLHPRNCRLIDALEARRPARATGARAARARLRVGRPRPSGRGIDRALEHLPRARRRRADEPSDGGGGAAAWRERVPARAVPARHAACRSACSPTRSRRRSPGSASRRSTWPSRGAAREALGEPCRVTCRFTHAYPDGPAPYFTVLAPARRGDEVAQWHEIKRAASDAIVAAGGTITHHHASAATTALVRRPAPRRRSPPRCARRSARSTPPGCSTPAC